MTVRLLTQAVLALGLVSAICLGETHMSFGQSFSWKMGFQLSSGSSARTRAWHSFMPPDALDNNLYDVLENLHLFLNRAS